jgi:hypothetical protein
MAHAQTIATTASVNMIKNPGLRAISEMIGLGLRDHLHRCRAWS